MNSWFCLGDFARMSAVCTIFVCVQQCSLHCSSLTFCGTGLKLLNACRGYVNACKDSRRMMFSNWLLTEGWQAAET